MKSLPFFFAVLTLSTLTACSSPQPDNVEKINHLQIPLVLPGKNRRRHRYRISRLFIRKINSRSRPNAQRKISVSTGHHRKEIFVADSDVQRVYASLTKLEQLDMVNQQYLKDNNVTGLQNIHIVLEPLFTS